MIIVDKALERREAEGKPVRVGMIGAGFMGRGIALQLLSVVPGMRLAAIANRHIEGAERAYREAGAQITRRVENVSELEDAIRSGDRAVAEDAMLLCQAEGIDVIIEVTGTVEFGAAVVLEAICNHKHVVVMNSEMDGTVGPILRIRADEAGVIYTNADGDQPGVTMNLYRFVKGIGVRPVLCGNIKGLQDPYRTPTTQAEFARKWKQKPHMVTSFADGTKISFEQAIVANATGMRVAKRGMHGPTVEPGTPIKQAVGWYPLEDMLEGPGIVDYVVGAEPGPGVFVLGTLDHPTQRHYLNLYKLGEGPLYCFYTPYHLCHFETPMTAARAVLFGDATLAPLGAPLVEVVATAKRKLREGEKIDGLGGYLTYGQAENAYVCRRERLLPMGLAENCVLERGLEKDAVLTYDDVRLPPGRLCDQLRAEQEQHFLASIPLRPSDRSARVDN
jgi:predicted homoserine dehydrogenase-like protein